MAIQANQPTAGLLRPLMIIFSSTLWPKDGGAQTNTQDSFLFLFLFLFSLVRSFVGGSRLRAQLLLWRIVWPTEVAKSRQAAAVAAAGSLVRRRQASSRPAVAATS